MSGTIVVGYDGEEPAKRALEAALADAITSGAHLVIAIALATPFDPTGPVGSYGTDVEVELPLPPPRLETSGEPAVLRPLGDQALARATAAGVTAECVFGVGDPARTIVDAARDRNASKIVIGRDQHTWFRKLFGEDVEAAVKREAGCPVVVVD